MRITILQPTYLPWLGYFEMIANVDRFVVFDHVQFEPKSWQHRNRIKGPNGEILLTVPVMSDGTLDVRIADKRIDRRQAWARKHSRSIDLAYRRAPYWSEYVPGIAEILLRGDERIVDLNCALIEYFMLQLGIRTPVVRSSSIVVDDDSSLGKTERIVSLCQRLGATELYDGSAAADFIDDAAFSRAGIGIRYQSYTHPVYPQIGAQFVPFMSVLDLILNCGPESKKILMSGAAG